MSDGFRLWWFEMGHRILLVGAVLAGVLIAFVLGRLVVRK